MRVAGNKRMIMVGMNGLNRVISDMRQHLLLDIRLGKGNDLFLLAIHSGKVKTLVIKERKLCCEYDIMGSNDMLIYIKVVAVIGFFYISKCGMFKNTNTFFRKIACQTYCITIWIKASLMMHGKLCLHRRF